MVELGPNHTIISPSISELKWDWEISDRLLQIQLATKKKLENQYKSEIHEIRIGFRTLGILWNRLPDTNHLQHFLDENKEPKTSALPTKTWKIPVCYEDEFAQDLPQLAKSKNMSPEDLIKLHSQNHYRIHFFGFLPGFMYLQGLAEKLYSARKSVPDRNIAAGSVAIGGSQTGIYPTNSPGGWHVIGRSPSSFFDAKKIPPVWASPGDLIRFYPITKEEFFRLGKSHDQPNLL
ncbi:5-oxoprolinase subunit PxpB [Algoriphagus aestuarii]|nr:5-oxoprolinase subunit PxpB [Algoriphagus aestuarii]